MAISRTTSTFSVKSDRQKHIPNTATIVYPHIDDIRTATQSGAVEDLTLAAWIQKAEVWFDEYLRASNAYTFDVIQIFSSYKIAEWIVNEVVPNHSQYGDLSNQLELWNRYNALKEELGKGERPTTIQSYHEQIIKNNQEKGTKSVAQLHEQYRASLASA